MRKLCLGLGERTAFWSSRSVLLRGMRCTRVVPHGRDLKVWTSLIYHREEHEHLAVSAAVVLASGQGLKHHCLIPASCEVSIALSRTERVCEKRTFQFFSNQARVSSSPLETANDGPSSASWLQAGRVRGPGVLDSVLHHDHDHLKTLASHTSSCKLRLPNATRYPV